MTLKELTARLNFNGHNAVEKVYKRAIKSLRMGSFAGMCGEFVRARNVLVLAQLLR